MTITVLVTVALAVAGGMISSDWSLESFHDPAQAVTARVLWYSTSAELFRQCRTFKWKACRPRFRKLADRESPPLLVAALSDRPTAG